MPDSNMVGVLTTLDAPLLPFLLQALISQSVTNLCVIADERMLSEKDKAIWKERTGEELDLGAVSLYELSGHEIPFYLVKNHNDANCVTLIRKLNLALLINGGTPRILKSPVLNASRQGVINVHPGILPHYRGSCCVEWAILNDDPVGITAHFMTEGIDEGPIVSIERIEVTESDDYKSIRVRTYKRSIALMASVTGSVLESGLKSTDLPVQGDGSFYKPISNEQLTIVKQRLVDRTYSFINSPIYRANS